MEINLSEVDPVMLEFELSGLVAEALKILLGNPDIITAMMSFSIFVTLCLVVINVYQQIR